MGLPQNLLKIIGIYFFLHYLHFLSIGCSTIIEALFSQFQTVLLISRICWLNFGQRPNSLQKSHFRMKICQESRVIRFHEKYFGAVIMSSVRVKIYFEIFFIFHFSKKSISISAEKTNFSVKSSFFFSSSQILFLQVCW